MGKHHRHHHKKCPKRDRDILERMLIACYGKRKPCHSFYSDCCCDRCRDYYEDECRCRKKVDRCDCRSCREQQKYCKCRER